MRGTAIKKTLLASEVERADVREARLDWRYYRQPAMQKQPGRLVFIDETSIKTNMTPLRGRALRGERLNAEAPFGKWETWDFYSRPSM